MTRKQGLRNGPFHLLIWLAALVVPVISVLLTYELLIGSFDSFKAFSYRFLIGTDWIPNPPRGLPSLGALPAIYGSVVTTLIGLLLAVPVSLGVALFQSELAPRILRNLSVFLTEMLAAVPSVVYGLWGLLILVPFMRDYIDPQLQSSLAFLPFFT